MAKPSPSLDAVEMFSGGGEMGRRILSFDWSRHPLGPPGLWPPSLKTAVRIMLNSRFAMWMGWGPEFYFFCNDAYLPTVGVKESWVLGASARKVWAEIWPDIGPRAEWVITSGQATWDESLMLFLERRGYPEETYHTFSYSPLPDDQGGIGGMLCVVTEDTDRVISSRRMATLNELATHLAKPQNESLLFAAVRRCLGENNKDIPLALVYLLDAEHGKASLACAHGMPEGNEIAPPEMAIHATGNIWPAKAVLEGDLNGITMVELDEPMERVPCGPWNLPPRQVAIVPLTQAAQEKPVGFLVAGINPYRPMDAAYSGFVNLLATQVAAALSNARAYDSERKRAEALAELNRAKTMFFSNVSHELRTPLTLMLGMMEEIVNQPEERLPSECRQIGEVAHRNGLRLLKLVNTLLDFSRMEAGRAEASYEPLDLAGFTAALAEGFRFAVEKAGLRLVLDCPPLSEPVYVDHDMWEKIILNLLSNAFKFTATGEIRVVLREADGWVHLSVEDTGSGIPEDAMPNLFERFYRVQGAAGRSHEGTGIGLALVQDLVKLHAGVVRVQSTLGTGSNFMVDLKMGADHLPKECIQIERRLASTAVKSAAYLEEALRWLPDSAEGEGRSTSSEPATTAAPHRFKVLVVDDNADMREHVRRLLATRFSVVTAEDGLRALEVIHQELPDLVLSDVMMPRLDGVGLLAELRGNPTTAALPVILLSARAGEEARLSGLGAGADDYVVKPFSGRELLARVTTHLELSRLRKETSERLEKILDRISDGFLALDKDAKVIYVNRQTAEHLRRLGKTREEITGKVLWQEFPEAMGTELQHAVQEVMEKQEAASLEIFADRLQSWLVFHLYPSPEGATVFFRDVTESKNALETLQDREEQLRQALEAAQQANRAKDDFLAALSHELRTPLSPVLLLASEESTNERLPAEVRSRFSVIAKNVALEARLIDDLLDLTRITRGKLILEKKPLSIHAILRDASAIVRQDLEEKRIHLELEWTAERDEVIGDPVRLQQVFWNVIKNAVKFTPAGGHISIETLIMEEPERIAVKVTDTGIGFTEDEKGAIFNAFVQGNHIHEEGAHRFGGLGLGLTISRLLTELHSGSIQAQSKGRDQGAVFVIELPLAPGTEERSHQPEETINTPAAAPPPPVQETHEEGRRILIVEDHEATRSALAQLLARRNYEVTTSSSVAEALDLSSKNAFDLVISDIGLPDGNGNELMAQLRDMHGLKGIALTGYGTDTDVSRSQESGFVAHLTKPVRVESLEAALAELKGLDGNGKNGSARGVQLEASWN